MKSYIIVCEWANTFQHKKYKKEHERKMDKGNGRRKINNKDQRWYIVCININIAHRRHQLVYTFNFVIHETYLFAKNRLLICCGYKDFSFLHIRSTCHCYCAFIYISFFCEYAFMILCGAEICCSTQNFMDWLN